MTRSQSTVDPATALSLHTSTVNVCVSLRGAFVALAASFLQNGASLPPHSLLVLDIQAFLKLNWHFWLATCIFDTNVLQGLFKHLVVYVNEGLQAAPGVLADEGCFDKSDDMNLSES